MTGPSQVLSEYLRSSWEMNSHVWTRLRRGFDKNFPHYLTNISHDLSSHDFTKILQAIHNSFQTIHNSCHTNPHPQVCSDTPHTLATQNFWLGRKGFWDLEIVIKIPNETLNHLISRYAHLISNLGHSPVCQWYARNQIKLNLVQHSFK